MSVVADSFYRLNVPDELRTEILARLREPGRFYHNLSHIGWMLRGWNRMKRQMPFYHWAAFEWAIWLHDIVYDSTAKDNEAQSAKLAQEWAFGACDKKLLERIILATAGHTPDPEGNLAINAFLDLDIGIFAASPGRYDWYARAIRKEYAWVPEDKYRLGRAAVLENFLAREKLYVTDMIGLVYREPTALIELRARENIEREIATLRAA